MFRPLFSVPDFSSLNGPISPSVDVMLYLNFGLNWREFAMSFFVDWRLGEV